MKSVFSSLILSNGSLLFVSRPCFRSFLRCTILVTDSINHPTWSSRKGDTRTEVSKFINKFDVKS